MQMHSAEQRWERVFRLRRNRPALQKNRCEIRSTSRASPRFAQDDARERAPYISPAFLSVEHPAVFAVLFEAAKAKFPQCNSRVRFSQMISSFGGSTRYRGDMGVLPHARFLSPVSLSRDKEIGNNPINVRNLCSHSLHHPPRKRCTAAAVHPLFILTSSSIPSLCGEQALHRIHRRRILQSARPHISRLVNLGKNILVLTLSQP